MMNKEQEVPQEDWNKPLRGVLPPLEALPEREWLQGKIVSVNLQYAMFNGKISYITDPETKEEVKDEHGEPIPRKEFEIKIELSGYLLPNGNPRNAWVRLGASLGKNAKLPVFLKNVLGESKSAFGDYEEMTPLEIKTNLEGKSVKLQMANKTSKEGKDYQVVVWDAVKGL